jgi:hypothetical protein
MLVLISRHLIANSDPGHFGLLIFSSDWFHVGEGDLQQFSIHPYHLQLPYDDAIWKQGLWKKTPILDEPTNRTVVNPESQGHFTRVIVLAYTLGRGAQYMLQDFNIRNRLHP